MNASWMNRLGPACAGMSFLFTLLVAPIAVVDGSAFFSSPQVSQGRWEYAQKCAVCHGAQLQGGGAPALEGREFVALWNGKLPSNFYDYVHTNMPLGQGGGLDSQAYANIVAYVLAQNGLPNGTERLTPQSAMDRAIDHSPAAMSGNVSAGAPPGVVKVGQLYGKLSQPTTSRPTQAELDSADASTMDWLMYNKGYRGGRYSMLKKINVSNAGRLRPVCMFQLGVLGTFSTGPVLYDGILILYATTHLGTYAIDAATCRKVWSHQHVAQGPEMNATNKGVAIAGGRVIRGTQDGFLYALDAKTGQPLWVRQVADWGIRGRMMAFNVADGSLAWAFDLIPTGSETGAGTWEKAGSAEHGGGAAWVAYALDRETGALFVPVGNPGPDFNKVMRPGANLFSISTVALDARTGKLRWWYQRRANDDHDWDATVVSLFDAGGRKLVATSGKEGILHVIGRDDGKLVFKLPMTTLLNHDAPLKPEGVRVCPVAGVQWNGAAHCVSTGLLYVNAIDWCTVFKSGPDPKWVATIPYTGLANGWGTNDPIETWSGWINAIDPTTGKMAWRVHTPTPMYAGLTPTAGNNQFTGDLNGNFLALDARNGRSSTASTPAGRSASAASPTSRRAGNMSRSRRDTAEGRYR